MPTMNAALGNSQFGRLDNIIKKRRGLAQTYDLGFNSIDDITILSPPKGFYDVYQKYPILIQAGKRDELKNHLAKEGIFSKPYFGEPVHLTKFYKNLSHYKEISLPITERLANEVLNLPIYPTLKKDEVETIISSIKRFIGL